MWSTCGSIKKLEDGEGAEASASPPGLLGPPFPLQALAAEGDGWATCRVTSGLTAQLGLWVCVGRGRRGTADHDLSTAGGHQLVPQCALSEGMEGLGLCQAGGVQVSSEAAGLPPNARPPSRHRELSDSGTFCYWRGTHLLPSGV